MNGKQKMEGTMGNTIKSISDKIRRSGYSDEIFVWEEPTGEYTMLDSGGRHTVDSLDELSDLVDESIQSCDNL